jgi:hypothetical protein
VSLVLRALPAGYDAGDISVMRYGRFIQAPARAATIGRDSTSDGGLVAHEQDVPVSFRESGAAQAGGYVLLVAGILVAAGLVFHPMPTGGFAENPSVLQGTPWWGPIHVAIAAGFVLCVLGGLLVLVAGGTPTRRWTSALSWGALTVGMIYFTGVALLNGWVIHRLAPHASDQAVLYDAMNQLMIGFGWLGNPLFLFGLTGIAALELRYRDLEMHRWAAAFGLLVALLSWLRGVGSATGWYFLEPFIVANIPAFLWLGYCGLLIAQSARGDGAVRWQRRPDARAA